MSRTGSQRRARRSRNRGWRHSLRWLLGGFLVCIGAMAGAFGTVGWMVALCSPSLTTVFIGVLGFGAVPVLAGSGLVWAGLALLESESMRSRVAAVSDDQIIAATFDGVTSATLAMRVALPESPELEARLDALVARELLILDLSEDGDLTYRPRPS